MKDQIIRGMACNNEIRFFAAYTKETVETARQIHGLSKVATAALGRTLTAGGMMGAMCKDEKEVLTIQIAGDGPLKKVTVTADAHSNVKGLVYDGKVEIDPRSDGHLDVGGAVGHHGMLTVIRDSGFAEPYVGQTALASGEIGDDLTYYFAESEQIPTSVGVGVLVNADGSVQHAGGFIIQLMPFASEATISALEASLAKFSSVTNFFADGKSPIDMIHDILGDDVTIEDEIPTQYKCNCSKERTTKALISLGKKEISEMIADGEPITLHCDFCNSDYTFSLDELKDILAHM